MKIIQQMMRKILNKNALFIILIFLCTPKVIGQDNAIPKWIEDVYISNNPNLDSIRKEIEKLPKQNTNLQTFKNYIESILNRDSSVNTLIKTMFILNALIKEQDTIYYKNLDYETRFFYALLFDKVFVHTNKTEFDIVRNTYNDIYDSLPGNFINKNMKIDKRRLAFYKQYMAIEPRLIGINKLRYFRYDSIYQYNDLILEYILKSPDSVDFQNYSFSSSLAGEALFTLLWFGDNRALPYYLYGVTHTPWEKTFFAVTAFRIDKEHQSKAIQYMQLKILKSLFEKEGSTSIQICDFVGLTIEIEDYPAKMLLNKLSSTCPEELPYDKKYILEQKPPEEIKQVALDIIDKKLKELEKERK